MVLANNPPNPNDFAGFLIWKTSNELEKYINSLLLPFDLIQSEIFHLIAIMQLVQAGKQVSQIEVSRSIGTTPMSTSKILRKLEKKHLISRVVGNDSRSKSIQITNDGLKILMSTVQILGDANTTFFANTNQEELTKNLKQIQN
jgi:DNA-binding MarR family transcriptional regulator